MAGPLIRDRAKETTSTTGTGTLSLAGAVSGFRTLVSAAGSGNSVLYAAEAGTDWEVGIGTVTSGSPSTLTRTTVLASSNAGALVSFASSPTVWIDLPAGYFPDPAPGGLLYFGSTGLQATDATNLYYGSGYLALLSTNFSAFKKTAGHGILLDGITGGDIEWYTASFGSGYGFRMYAADIGGGTEWKVAGRNNSASWTDFLRMSDTGTVNLANAKWLGWRNAADSADVSGWRLDSSNRLEFGTELYHEEVGWTPTGTGLFVASKAYSGNALPSAYEGLFNVKATVSGLSSSLAEGRIVAQYEWADGASTNQQITSATNATPIVITTVANHGLTSGARVCISGVTGNTNANGIRYANVLTATTFSLYAETGLSTAIAGNGAYSPVTVTGATNATPIVISATAHGFAVGDFVGVWNVLGNTAANGLWRVKTVPDANTFTIQRRDYLDVTGNGAYTSGGSAGKGWVTNQSFGFCAFYRVNPGASNHRGGTNFANIDDLNGLAVMNVGSALATDAFYLARNSVLTYEWWTSMSLDANTLWGIRLGGTYLNAGIDLHGTFNGNGIDTRGGTFPASSAVLLGNSHLISAANAAGTSNYALLKLNSADVVELSGGALYAGIGTTASVGIGATPTAGKLHVSMGTQASAGDAVAISAQWNNGAVTFNSYRARIYDQASKKDSNFIDCLLSTDSTNYFSKFRVDKNGNVFANSYVGNTFKEVKYQPSPGTTTILGIGDTAATATGTASVVNNAGGGWINYLHAATTAGTKAGWERTIATHGCTQQQFGPVETVSVMTTATAADIAGAVWHFGLYSADPTNTVPASLTGDFAAFVFDPAGNSHWQTVSRDNTTTESNVTTVTVAVSTRYYLRIDMNSGVDIKFYINNVLVATHTTRLPRATVALNRYDKVTITAAGAGTARNFLINLVQGEQE